MRYCTNCGHQLGIGRYCTNCGARVPVPPADPPRTQEDFPTAVRPTAVPPLHPYGDDPLNTDPPPPPPPLGPPPTSARFPLYAEDTVAAPAPLPVVVPTVPVEARRRPVFPWVLAVLVIAVVAAVGGLLLLLGGSGEDGADDPVGGQRSSAHRTASSAADEAGEDGDQGAAGPVEPADVQVPGTAPASVDSAGERVTFTAANMLDGDARTAWRVAGDASGSVVTFTFDRPVTLTEVGLVNGYAKTDPPHDWYHGNRRITDVVWVFDDGTEIGQELGDSTSVQTTGVESIRTTTLELRILAVSAPGEGADSRDYTAISEVELTGR